LNPSLWEELFFRGVMMILLLQLTRSLKRAFAIQIVIFGLAHIKGFDFWAFVDVVSVMVMAVGLTYAAYKTRALVAAIVWHYFHDAFLYTVQLPSDVSKSITDNVLFHGSLWLGIGIACLLTKLATDRLGVQAKRVLYSPDGPWP
jgi:membrane protease YdiL (CAAX protease family)